MENIVYRQIMPGLELDQVIRDHEYSMVTRHFHDTYELYYLVEGERYYFIDKETYLVKQGDVVLVKPNQIHKTSLAEHSYHNRMLLQIRSDMLDPFLRSNGLHTLEELYNACDSIIQMKEEDQKTIELLMVQIREEMEKKQKHYELMVRMKLAELLVVLSRYRAKEAFYQESQKVQTVKHQKVHEVADYLLSHPETEESLEELAARFYISKSYLSRIFKEVTSFTVNEYININRVKKAQSLLIHSEYSVTEIAGMLGFESITYFERVFRKYADSAPLKYRKKYKQ